MGKTGASGERNSKRGEKFERAVCKTQIIFALEQCPVTLISGCNESG
jgi:hypothetical protein